jgi:hypothetical protein
MRLLLSHNQNPHKLQPLARHKVPQDRLLVGLLLTKDNYQKV